MTASAHDRYRRELALLADDRRLLDALDLDDRWQRRYGRFFPDREPFAVLTLQGPERLCRVDVFREPALRFAITDVADDPALPGLRALLDAGAEIVRYHPGRRCTVRHGERFGKLLAGAPAVLRAQRE